MSIIPEVPGNPEFPVSIENTSILQRLLDSKVSGFWRFRLDQGTAYYSPGFKSMLGYRDDDCPNTPELWFELCHPLDRADRRKELEAFLANGKEDSFSHETRFLHLNGDIVWVLCSGQVLNRDADGRIIDMAGFHIDITQSKNSELEKAHTSEVLRELNYALLQANHEANRLRRAAEASSKSKSAFLANMSHELRTPMNGILGMLDLLLETPLTPQQREYIDIVRSSSTTLHQLLNDILDLSRIEANKVILEDEAFEIRDLLSATVYSAAHQARQKGVEFKLTVEDSVPVWVKGDPKRLRQVLTNLLENAVKFTSQGHIHLRCALEGHLKRSGLMMRFFVEDTGIGIPADFQKLIFEKFTQADDKSVRRFGGAGLGLSICKQLVEMMKGDLTVSSTEGAGSTFTFSVLMKPVESDSPVDEIDLSGLDRHKTLPARKVLVVDDNPVNRKVAQVMLQKLGQDCFTVAGAAEAFVALKDPSFDLVFMDWQMPGMDGVEATRIIRASGKDNNLSKIPIIAMTAHAMSEDLKVCLDAGMNATLTKPFTLPQLKSILENWLPKDPG